MAMIPQEEALATRENSSTIKGMNLVTKALLLQTRNTQGSYDTGYASQALLMLGYGEVALCKAPLLPFSSLMGRYIFPYSVTVYFLQ